VCSGGATQATSRVLFEPLQEVVGPHATDLQGLPDKEHRKWTGSTLEEDAPWFW